MSRKVLTFDFGASSGRALLAEYSDGKIVLNEVHRFSNDPVELGGTLYWDVLRLYHEIKQGMARAMKAGGFDAIGIDTWGVDFGLLDKYGYLLENPVHYRDLRTKDIPDEVFKIIPKDIIYSRTGIQFMRINTLYQLYYLSRYRKDLIDRAEKLLFMPDLFAYFLTGEMRTEETIASTSNLQNPKTKEWDRDLICALGIPGGLFAPKIKPGEVYGCLRPQIAEEIGCDRVPVFAVPSHDTASAVLAVPSDKKDFIYISCGTWSLFGTELCEPLMSKESEKAGFTNESGAGGTIRFLKNIMGLWLFQESFRKWKKEDPEVNYKILDEEAANSAPFACFVNPDAAEFETPGDMPERIKEFCRKTGQYVPQTRGEILRCIYESLALKYRYALKQISDLTGKSYDTIHMVGGGVKAKILCEFTASACGMQVLAGPSEATAMGNASSLLMSLGEIKDIKEIRSVIKSSMDLNTYEPQNTGDWDKAYEEFEKILNA